MRCGRGVDPLRRSPYAMSFSASSLKQPTHVNLAEVGGGRDRGGGRRTVRHTRGIVSRAAAIVESRSSRGDDGELLGPVNHPGRELLAHLHQERTKVGVRNQLQAVKTTNDDTRMEALVGGEHLNRAAGRTAPAALV